MLNIELRKVSHNRSLSEETNAYTAQVWVDGKHFCDVSNHGQGGCDEQHPAKGKTWEDIKALNDTIKATYPKHVFDGHELDNDLEMVCADLLTEHLIARDLKRDLSKKILFIKPGERGIWTVKKRPTLVEQQIVAVKKHHGIAKTLNEMPFEEAVKLYREAA